VRVVRAGAGCLGGARSLAVDVGRKTHRYLPKTYRACDAACREQTARFVRLHMALGPLLWTLAGSAFLVGIVALFATLPPPLRLLWLEAESLFALLGILALLGTASGVLTALLPYVSIARGPRATRRPCRCGACACSTG